MCSKFLTSSPYIRKYAFHANKLNNGYELKKKVQKSSPGGPWFAGERPTVQGRWRPTSGGRRPCLAAPTSGEVETMKQFIATEQKKIHNRTKREQNIKTWKIKISYKPIGSLLLLFWQWKIIIRHNFFGKSLDIISYSWQFIVRFNNIHVKVSIVSRLHI